MGGNGTGGLAANLTSGMVIAILNVTTAISMGVVAELVVMTSCPLPPRI
jgi:hypothetical protein